MHNVGGCFKTNIRLLEPSNKIPDAKKPASKIEGRNCWFATLCPKKGGVLAAFQGKKDIIDKILVWSLSDKKIIQGA